jgi:hypothetical protein
MRPPKAWVAEWRAVSFPMSTLGGDCSGCAAWGKARQSVRHSRGEIWCQWHPVVFVRLKGDGAIGMGPGWSKDRCKPGHPGRCGHGWHLQIDG